jgi:hypothetical protein
LNSPPLVLSPSNLARSKSYATTFSP